MPSPDPRRHKTWKLVHHQQPNHASTTPFHDSARAADALIVPSTHRHSIPVLAPGPPKLPVKEQAEFERLQCEATVSSAFQPEPANAASETTTQAAATADTELNEGGGLYRDVRPEFEGDKNPRTGEVGGPKNEPLRWGSEGDWSYNGKVTDF
ncbi:hypothetical protein NHJ13051_001107 [Beauveria bassiana]